jgi:D-alanyl-D-alanine dipeptidase
MCDAGDMLRLIVMVIATFTSLPPAAAQTRPPSFVDAASVAPNLVIDMRYLGSDNFVGRPIDGYEKPVCYLTREAAAALAAVARDIEPQGLAIKAFDCYRPVRAVAHFVRWAQNLADVTRKTEFYPDTDKRDLFRDGYIAARSGHSRGSTLDMTLVRRLGGKDLGGKDLGGEELDMGTPFDFFSPRSAPSDTSVSAAARANRRLLAEAMQRRGFIPYSKEWWHFTLRGEPFPDTYFDFPVR